MWEPRKVASGGAEAGQFHGPASINLSLSQFHQLCLSLFSALSLAKLPLLHHHVHNPKRQSQTRVSMGPLSIPHPLQLPTACQDRARLQRSWVLANLGVGCPCPELFPSFFPHGFDPRGSYRLLGQGLGMEAAYQWEAVLLVY